MNVNTIFKLLPAVVLSVITMESCQNMDKNENTKEEKNAIEIIMARKSVRSYINPEKPDVPLNKNDAFQKVQKRRVQEKR